jgi:ABC-type multidrug transport system fused ATPase/permease subunit
MPFYSLVQLFNSYNSQSGNFANIFNTLETEEKVIDTTYAKEYEIKGNIEIKNLTFAYENENVLNDINLKVKVGQKLVLCGNSGCGKSTLIELLARLYCFNQGEIFIDGNNINSIKLNSIQKQIGIAQPNSFILNDTILTNIQFANPEKSLEECKQVISEVGLNDVIETLGGYNQIIGEGGIVLTDIQKQAINVCRLVVKNPNIVIYDEAFSALSLMEEAKFLTKLKDFFKNKTMIIVTNNPYIIEKCDFVYYMENGKVLEYGKYDELINNNNAFTKYMLNKSQ